MSLKGWVLIIISFFTITVTGQEVIEGWIYDEHGRALIGVNVYCPESEAGTITNIKGFFSLESECDSLVVSYVGYITTKVSTTDNPFNLRMIVNPNVLSCPTIILPSPILLATENIWKKEVEATSGFSISPLLNNHAGVLMHTGALNTNRITIRGIGNRSPFSTVGLRAYIDGIPLTNGVGETTLEDIDLGIIDNLNIHKGPTSSLNGAALGGMIQLQTSPIDYQDKVEVNHGQEYGSFGARLYSTAIERSWTDLAKVKIAYSAFHKDGYRDNNEYNRQNISLYGKRLFGQTMISILGLHTRLKAFIPSSLNEEDFQSQPTKAADNWADVMGNEDYNRSLLGIRFWRPLNEVLSLEAILYGQSFDQREIRPFNTLEDESISLGSRIRFHLEVPKHQLNIDWGGDFYREDYNWKLYSDDSQMADLISDFGEDREVVNLFIESEYSEPNDYYIQTGINANHTSYDLTDYYTVDQDDQSGRHTFNWTISPRIGIGKYITNQRTLLYGLISHGFSTPTSEETLLPDGNYNKDLKPEVGWNFEVGLNKNRNGSRVNYKIGLYWMDVRNLIVSRRVTEDQFIGVNAGKTRHQGVEVGLSYRWRDRNEALQIITKGEFEITNHRFIDFSDVSGDYKNNDLTGSPPHHSRLSLNSTYKGLEFIFGVRWMGAYALRDDNSIYSDSYIIGNSRVAYETNLTTQLEGRFFLAIGNLFDRKYAAMHVINARAFGNSQPRYFYPGDPRSISVGIQIGFKH